MISIPPKKLKAVAPQTVFGVTVVEFTTQDRFKVTQGSPRPLGRSP